MARSFGPHHSDVVKGSVGSLTHRVYRGSGTVSRHRSPTRKRAAPASINSPQDILGCWSRFNAGLGFTLRSVPPLYYLTNLIDVVGGLQRLSQPSLLWQPYWYAADPAHNNRPYILPDGTQDFMDTPVITFPQSMPIEIWIVAANSPFDSTTRALLRLTTPTTSYFARSNVANAGWRWQPPGNVQLAPNANDSVRVWRLKFINWTLQVEWNGINQSIPRTITPQTFNLLRLFSVSPATAIYNRKLFEIAIWLRTLNPVEAKLLLRWYRSWFNI